ncbi:MAG: YdcF family protein [bacterium]
MRRPVRLLLVFLIVLLAIYAGRTPAMRAAGRFLHVETEVWKSDVIYVFAGAALERGLQGAELYREGIAPVVVTAGEVLSPEMMALELDLTAAEITGRALERFGVPPAKIVMIERGTSTLEEAVVLREYMEENGLDSVVCVTSPFHTRRVRATMRKVFREEETKIYISAAKHPLVDLDNWWKKEEDLITVQNEYIKLVLYYFKYILLSDHPVLRNRSVSRGASVGLFDHASIY